MLMVKDNSVSQGSMTGSWSHHDLGDDAVSYPEEFYCRVSFGGVGGDGDRCLK